MCVVEVDRGLIPEVGADLSVRSQGDGVNLLSGERELACWLGVVGHKQL